MAAWSRKTLKFCQTTPYGKMFKILFRKFLPPRRLKLMCWNFVKFSGRVIGEIVRYLPDKKSPASQTVATARIVPKICQDQPQQCTRGNPDLIQIGSLSEEL